MIRGPKLGLLALLVLGLSTACAGQYVPAQADGKLRVVTTTGILADLTRQVAGDSAEVTALIPDGADPHSYEPTMRTVRDVVQADVAFSNYLMLEEHAIIRTLDANLPKDSPHRALAEGAPKYGAEVISLVEDFGLDTAWLGLRVTGTGAKRGGSRSSQVLFKAKGVTGPGEISAYLTETFGKPKKFFASSDGFKSSDGYSEDTLSLPADAHTHMSWAFTEPGIYRLRLGAQLEVTPDARPQELGETEVIFAVGVPPESAGVSSSGKFGSGHGDITVNLEDGKFLLRVDPELNKNRGSDGPGETTPQHSESHAKIQELDLRKTVIEVPTKALGTVPASPDFRFSGRPGSPIYLLPQAVLGKHVHGEIDPHLWHDVRNVKAYIKLIKEELMAAAPAQAEVFKANADQYLLKLNSLDDFVFSTIQSIPQDKRKLVTSHDSFGYLAAAYGLDVAGLVTPSPAIEPSLADRTRLVRTLVDLQVPAVFLEPTLRKRSSVLGEVAKKLDIKVCPLISDSFTEEIQTYVELMEFNARSLQSCLV